MIPQKKNEGIWSVMIKSIYIWCEFRYNIQLFVVKVIYLNLLKSIISYNYLQQKLLQRLSNYIKETFV